MGEYQCMDDAVIEKEKDKVNQLLDESVLEHKAAIFKILGDLNRVKIVELLSHYPQLCVNEISQFIDATVATTSHHLITLKNTGIIKSVKEGKRVIYMLDADSVTNLFDIADVLRSQCPNHRKLMK